jgi:hypothetical protein
MRIAAAALAVAWAGSIAAYAATALSAPALADSSFPSIDSASYCNSISAFITSPGSPGSEVGSCQIRPVNNIGRCYK